MASYKQGIRAIEYGEPSTVSPERKLLRAMMIRALMDIGISVSIPSAKDKREAADWIQDQSESEFSFNWVCQHLDIDPKRMRISILHFQKRAAA